MATESSNLYAPPKSAVKDVGRDETLNLASRGSRLAAVILDGIFGFICFTPAYIQNFATLIQQARGNPVAFWIIMRALLQMQPNSSYNGCGSTLMA